MHKTITWVPLMVCVACAVHWVATAMCLFLMVSRKTSRKAALYRYKPIKVRLFSVVAIRPRAHTRHDPDRFFQYSGLCPSKMEDRVVMSRIADIIRKFDVVAIQEIRSADQRLLPRLIDYINADGMQYEYLLGPRLGRTSSMEQYAYVYDTTRILASPDASYTVNDGHPGPGTRQEVGREGIPDLCIANLLLHASWCEHPIHFASHSSISIPIPTK